ncbi:MAG: DNA repair exonuclease [Deltaproteobacteria bacterium]|nr:DNA repair exonuclease [Deltaproteobacteria bacterium]
MNAPTRSRPRSPLRLAHASDIHLDTDYHDGSPHLLLRDRYRDLFGTLLERILTQEPQVLLLPGDLFDSNRPSAQTVAWVLERLGSLPLPVVLIPGNHDCMEENSIYHRHDFSALPNVTFLSDPQGETAILEPLRLALWGRGMVAHAPEFQPLQGMPAPHPEYWNVALGHGIYMGDAALTHRSSPVLSAQIARSGFDYIALGHHHALRDVSEPGTAAWYCGSPMPISPGSSGTFLIADLNPDHPTQVSVHHL